MNFSFLMESRSTQLHKEKVCKFEAKGREFKIGIWLKSIALLSVCSAYYPQPFLILLPTAETENERMQRIPVKTYCLWFFLFYNTYDASNKICCQADFSEIFRRWKWKCDFLSKHNVITDLLCFFFGYKNASFEI